MKLITNSKAKAYLEDRGRHCPHCGSDNLQSGGPVFVDEDTAWQLMTCNNCHEEWEDQYSLSGIRNVPIEPGEAHA